MPKRKRKKQYRLVNSSQHDELEDARGKVKVLVRAVGDDGTWRKGNITKTFTLNNATVSEVANDVFEALGGET